MRNSKNNILLTLTLFGLSLFCTGLVAQDKDKEEKKKSKWERSRYERPVRSVHSVPSIPSMPSLPSIPSIPSIPSLPSMASIPSIPSVPSLPSMPSIPSMPSFDANFSAMHWDNGDRMSVEYSNDELGINIKASGRIRLTADKKSIRSIRNDGFLLIKEQDRDKGREIYIETDKNGELVYDFYRKGKKLDFDKEGKAWLATIWDDLVELLDK